MQTQKYCNEINTTITKRKKKEIIHISIKLD